MCYTVYVQFKNNNLARFLRIGGKVQRFINLSVDTCT